MIVLRFFPFLTLFGVSLHRNLLAAQVLLCVAAAMQCPECGRRREPFGYPSHVMGCSMVEFDGPAPEAEMAQAVRFLDLQERAMNRVDRVFQRWTRLSMSKLFLTFAQARQATMQQVITALVQPRP